MFLKHGMLNIFPYDFVSGSSLFATGNRCSFSYPNVWLQAQFLEVGLEMEPQSAASSLHEKNSMFSESWSGNDIKKLCWLRQSKD